MSTRAVDSKTEANEQRRLDAAFARGMLAGADQILEQDESLRAERDALAARVRDLEGLLGRVKVARDEGWYEDDPHWAEIDAGIAALAPTQRST